MKVTWRIGDNISFTGGIEGLGSISEPENEIKNSLLKSLLISATQCSKNLLKKVQYKEFSKTLHR